MTNEMTKAEKAAYNKAIDDCLKAIHKEGFRHTGGLSQFIPNLFIAFGEKVEGMKL